MKHLFVPYEIALKLKEKGFDEPCLGYYRPLKTWMKDSTRCGPNWRNKENTHYFMYVANAFGDRDKNFSNVFDESKGGYHNIATPLYQQVTDWLLEKHHINIHHSLTGDDDTLIQDAKHTISIYKDKAYSLRWGSYVTPDVGLFDTKKEAYDKA